MPYGRFATSRPEPPRDLWARTASAIERESAGAGRREAGRRPSRIPLGALSGIAVIAVVIGVSTLSGGFLNQGQDAFSEKPSDQTSTTGGDGGSEATIAQATPFSVFAGPVQWVDTSANGSLAYNRAPVDEVCPTADTSGCPTLKDASQQDLAIDNKPRTIIESPTDGQAVAVADNGAGGGDQLIIFDLPEASPAPPPTPIQTPIPTPTRSAAPTGSAVAASSTPASAEPPSATPTPPEATDLPDAVADRRRDRDAIGPAAAVALTVAGPLADAVHRHQHRHRERHRARRRIGRLLRGWLLVRLYRPARRPISRPRRLRLAGRRCVGPPDHDRRQDRVRLVGRERDRRKPALLIRSKSTESTAVPVTVHIDPTTGRGVGGRRRLAARGRPDPQPGDRLDGVADAGGRRLHLDAG